MICDLNHIPGERTTLEELTEFSDRIQLSTPPGKKSHLRRRIALAREETEERRILRGYSLPRGQHENWG